MQVLSVIHVLLLDIPPPSIFLNGQLYLDQRARRFHPAAYGPTFGRIPPPTTPALLLSAVQISMQCDSGNRQNRLSSLRHLRIGDIPPRRAEKNYFERRSVQVGKKKFDEAGNLFFFSRPEKDHAAQLDAFAEFRRSYATGKDVKLVLVGGSRNDGDAQRVANLRKQAKNLGIEVRHLRLKALTR